MRSRLRLLLSACFVLALACGQAAYAQNETTPESSPTSISDKIASLKANFEKLQQLWSEQKALLDAALKQQAILEQALKDSQLELDQLTTSLQQSRETSTALSETFTEYKQATEREIRRRTIAAVLAGVVGTGAGVLIGVLIR